MNKNIIDKLGILSETNRMLIVFCFLVISFMLNAQEEGQNTIIDVQNNTVTPCDKTIGTIVTVKSAAEFRQAINAANSIGGNITVLIEDGEYQVTSISNNSISFPYISADNIVIRSASGNRESVILKGGGMRPTSTTEDVFLISGNNVTIADITIQECGNHGIQVSGANLLVHNVHIKDTYEMLLKGATSGFSIDSAIVQCSLFEYTAGIGPNWYIAGLDIHKGKDWIVRDNVFKNIQSPSRAEAEHAVHFWNNSSNNIIERNLIINCDRGIGFGLGSSGNSGGIIRNNMIYNDGTGLFTDVGIGVETSPNTKIYNNTVFIEKYHNAIEYRFEATTGVEIKNNLTNKPITSRNGGQAKLATNVPDSQPFWFTDVASGDLFLGEEINAVVNMGTDLSLEFTEDILKMKRPQGENFDIGAHEWSSVTGFGHYNRNSGVSIFPNPNSGKFSVQLLNDLLVGNQQFNVEIFDLSGKKVYTSIIHPTQDKMDIDISNFQKGFYILQLFNGNSIKTNSIILVQ